MDSTLRGHVGEEVAAALSSWSPAAVAVVAPAFPDVGRTTVGGEVCLRGLPLGGTTIATRLRDAGVPTGAAGLADVRGGALTDLLAFCYGGRDRAVVCDAETMEDLTAIARAGLALGGDIVWVGSGGLARALAPCLRDAPAVPRLIPAPRNPERQNLGPGGPVLIVVGSATEAAHAQVAHVARAGAVSVVVAASVLRDGGSLAHLTTTVADHLRARRDVVLSIGDDAGGDGGDDARLAARIGRLLQSSAALVGGAVLTGGETALAVLRAWGVTGLRLVDEVEPGVPRSVTIGACMLPVVTKAGAFGDEGTLERVRQALTAARPGQPTEVAWRAR